MGRIKINGAIIAKVIYNYPIVFQPRPHLEAVSMFGKFSTIDYKPKINYGVKFLGVVSGCYN